MQTFQVFENLEGLTWKVSNRATSPHRLCWWQPWLRITISWLSAH